MFIDNKTIKKQVAEIPDLEKQLFIKRQALVDEYESAENLKNADVMEKLSHKGHALEFEMMHFIAYKVNVMAFFISQNPDYMFN
jgi:hydroxymethylpyrimidine pyrophosphatase-like HAD family hydrolase